MSNAWWLLPFWVAIFAAPLLRTAAAQEAPPATEAPALGTSPDSETAADPAGAAVEEVYPEVIHLWDKRKNLVALPGFTLEDFMEYYREKHRLSAAEARPRYNLQQLTIAGAALRDRAELNVLVKVVVGDAGWVRVPLRLGQAILREKAAYEGEGEHLLEYDEDKGGYVAWLRGKEKSEHELSFNVLVPLEVAGAESRLSLTAPRATTSSLAIVAPAKEVTAVTSVGASPPSTKPAADGKTEISVLGLGGDFSLSWRDAAARAAAIPVVIEANSTAYWRLDGRSARTEAAVVVRSFGGEFDRFQLRLPRDAQLVSEAQPGYSFNAERGSPLIEVQLDRKTSGPVEVHLATEAAYDATQADQWMQLAGFEVVGAVRQWGHVAVAVSGDWQIVWGKQAGVRRVDELPETLRRKEAAAGFEILSQPASLEARLAARTPRVSVEPEYVCLVDASQTRLEARCRYMVRGAKVFSLQIDVEGWEIEEVGPPNVADTNAWSQEGAVLEVTLAQPTLGEMELTFVGRKATSQNTLDFVLPRPQADSASSATVVVSPADNIELKPKGADLVGLKPQPGGLRNLPGRQQAPLIFWAEAPRARFAADLIAHAQAISVQVESRIEVQRDALRVEQSLSYQVAYEPIHRFVLQAPAAVADAGKIEFSLGEQALTPVIVQPGGPEGGPARLQLELPESFMGGQLSVRYSLPVAALASGQSAPVIAELVMPDEGRLTSNRVSVHSEAGLRAVVGESPWASETGGTGPPAGQPLRLSAKGSLAKVPLEVELNEAPTATTIVERAWVQTWLTESARQDRALFRLSASLPQLKLNMPAGLAAEHVEVVLDGRPQEVTWADENVLWVDLASEGAAVQGSRLLEVRYYFQDQGMGRGKFALEIPTFGEDVWVRRMYWELVLPPHEHVVRGPPDGTAEFSWQWKGYYWGRAATLEQADLEDWIGAPHERDLSAATNRYVYSMPAPTAAPEVWTAGRSWLVFSASLAVMVAGLCLIYVPRRRHPAMLLVGAVGLVGLALAYPDAALLAAQAAGLGVLLMAAAVWLQRSASRRRRRGMVVRGAPSSIFECPGAPVLRPHPGGKPSSVTVALGAQLPEAK